MKKVALILQLQTNLLNLYTRGKFCKSVLQESENGVPEHYYQDEEGGLEKIMNWFDNEFNLINSRRDQQRMQSKQQSSIKRSKPARRRR